MWLKHGTENQVILIQLLYQKQQHFAQHDPGISFQKFCICYVEDAIQDNYDPIFQRT